MRKISTLLAAAAIGTVTTSGTGASTVEFGSDSLEFFDRLTHETKETQGNPHLGQVRITPEAGHAAGAPQVYAVRDENDQKQCIIGSHLAKKSTAYSAEVFDAIVQSGTLDALNDAQEIDIKTLTRNGAYAYPANTTPPGGGGGGCVIGCTPTPPPPCKVDCGPAPVPLPLGGLMLLGGLGMLGGIGRLRKKGPSLDL